MIHQASRPDESASSGTRHERTFRGTRKGIYVRAALRALDTAFANVESPYETHRPTRRACYRCDRHRRSHGWGRWCRRRQPDYQRPDQGQHDSERRREDAVQPTSRCQGLPNDHLATGSKSRPSDHDSPRSAKNSQISVARSSGCSSAAKCPPRSKRVQRRRSVTAAMRSSG